MAVAAAGWRLPSGSYPTARPRSPPQRAAKETFGWDGLHAYQLEAMEHVLDGHDVLAVLPTRAGKSAIYQVPALLLDGLALVVSPLLALQRDQVEALTEAGAPAAVVVDSSQSAAERRGQFTLQAAVGPGVVMSVEDDRLTVLFEDAGYRTLSVEAVEDNDLLRLGS